MATKLIVRIAVLLLISVLLGGCTYGLLYTDTTQPLVLNMRATPRGISRATEAAKFISIPTTALSAGWSNRAIGDAAKLEGLDEIYYADLRTFSVLLGLWQEKTVVVYGK